MSILKNLLVVLFSLYVSVGEADTCTNSFTGMSEECADTSNLSLPNFSLGKMFGGGDEKIKKDEKPPTPVYEKTELAKCESGFEKIPIAISDSGRTPYGDPEAPLKQMLLDTGCFKVLNRNVMADRSSYDQGVDRPKVRFFLTVSVRQEESKIQMTGLSIIGEMAGAIFLQSGGLGGVFDNRTDTFSANILITDARTYEDLATTNATATKTTPRFSFAGGAGGVGVSYGKWTDSPEGLVALTSMATALQKAIPIMTNQTASR